MTQRDTQPDLVEELEESEHERSMRQYEADPVEREFRYRASGRKYYHPDLGRQGAWWRCEGTTVNGGRCLFRITSPGLCDLHSKQKEKK